MLEGVFGHGSKTNAALIKIALLPIVGWICLIVDETNKMDIFWIYLCLLTYNAIKTELICLTWNKKIDYFVKMIKNTTKRKIVLQSLNYPNQNVQNMARNCILYVQDLVIRLKHWKKY